MIGEQARPPHSILERHRIDPVDRDDIFRRIDAVAALRMAIIALQRQGKEILADPANFEDSFVRRCRGALDDADTNIAMLGDMDEDAGSCRQAFQCLEYQSAPPAEINP